MRIAIGGIVCLVVLAIAPAAQGAQRYASPAGAGGTCTREAPCALDDALSIAVSNDEVILLPGTYFVNSFLPFGGVQNLQVHGDFGGPMPRVIASLPTGSVFVLEEGGRLSHLEITNTGANAIGLYCFGNNTIERVRLSVTGTNVTGVSQEGACQIRDSVIRAAGTAGAVGIGAPSQTNVTSRMRNLTVVASGPSSYGITAGYTGGPGGGFSFDLKNSIVAGDTGDLFAYSNGNGLGTIYTEHSNFDAAEAGAGATIVDLGGNQKAAPLFVDAAAGNYREAAGSPTIDAGIVDPFLGALDPDGNARTLGAAPDIGAFEFVPTAAPPALPGEIQSLSVKPAAFRAAGGGDAVLSAKKGKGKRKPPTGATVAYSLSATATVQFSVERKVSGRRVGKRCVKKTAANKAKGKCPLFKPVKGGFTHSGAAGANSFKFSGRLAKALPPGSYRLTGKTGGASRAASFKIVR